MYVDRGTVDAAKFELSSKLSILALRHMARLMACSGTIPSAQNTGPLERFPYEFGKHVACG